MSKTEKKIMTGQKKGANKEDKPLAEYLARSVGHLVVFPIKAELYTRGNDDTIVEIHFFSIGVN